MRRLALSAAVCCIPLFTAAAQAPTNSPREDSTLAGIHTVGLLISDISDALGGSTVEQLTSSTQLELRKAGLRVVRVEDDGSTASPIDALVQVQFFRRGRFSGDDVDMRLLVRQRVKLMRTDGVFWETTWGVEHQGQNQDVRNAAPKYLAAATNEFLSKWLDMNGR